MDHAENISMCESLQSLPEVALFQIKRYSNSALGVCARQVRGVRECPTLEPE